MASGQAVGALLLAFKAGRVSPLPTAKANSPAEGCPSSADTACQLTT